MIVIWDVGCDAGIYFSETLLRWAVSVCLCYHLCYGDITPLPERAEGYDSLDGRRFWDPGHEFCLLSAHFLFGFHYPNCLAARLKMSRTLN